MTAQYVTMKEIGLWLGRSKSAVHRYCHEPHSPRPDTYVRGCPRWLPERVADWRKWFVTYGPGRPDALGGASRLKMAREVRRKYEAGATVRALAVEYGHAYGTIHNLLREANTKMRVTGPRSSPG